MKKEEKVNLILSDLTNNGSRIDYLEDLKKRSLDLLKKDFSMEEVLNSIAKEVSEETEEFLSKKNKFGVDLISGISTCIYLPDFNGNGEYKLKLVGGDRNRSLSFKVDENTMFDVASITKVFTLLLLFKLEEKGIIDLDSKVKDINPDFQSLEDFTLNDLVRLHGELRTNGNITQAKNKEEAFNILKTLYLESSTREENKYTDFGAIVISDTIAKVVSKKIGRQMSFDEIMQEYLIKPLGLNNTGFNPTSDNLSGNGNNLRLVHDPKSRILGGAVGSAGIFTTSDDLATLAREIYSVKYINKKHIARLGEITFPNSPQSNKGNLGIYVKHPLGLEKTYTPNEFSTGSFSHQGWTGPVALFDPNNLIHTNILVNAIYQSEDKESVRSDKPVGFGAAFDEYEAALIKRIILMYVAKKYYNKYCNVRENIDIVKRVK